jgi:hypothetical protein
MPNVFVAVLALSRDYRHIARPLLMEMWFTFPIPF